MLALSSGVYWEKGQEGAGHLDYDELIRLKLVEPVTADELAVKNASEGRKYGFAVRPTELGRQAQEFLKSVVAAFVQTLARDTAKPAR